MNKKPLLLIFIIFLVFGTLYTNCSKTPLTRYLELNSTGLTASFCTQKASDVRSNMKFIFIMDRSGSNQTRYTTDTPPLSLPGTDPDGNLRFPPLLNFISSYQNTPNVFWSLINFSTNAQVLGNDFDPDVASFYGKVQNQQIQTQTLDTGWTDYLKALTAARTLITEDIKKAKEQFPIVASTYVVFFISDGAPIVSGNVMLSSSEIYASVEGMLSLKNENPLLVEAIRFNTGFYYSDANPDATARTLLTEMAKRGYGEYLEFGGGAQIDFSKYSALVRQQRFDLKELWFVNASVAWNGYKLAIDDDSDSIPNDVEAAEGSDPNLADSDNNSVGDAVERKISGKACKAANCARVGAATFIQCNNFQRVNGIYVDRDGDGLNDCEEALLGSDIFNFDSNNDYLPDDLALRYGLSTLANARDLYLDPDQDGPTNYSEIKQGTPLREVNSMAGASMTARLSLKKTSESADQTCYTMGADNVPSLGDGNLMKIYLIENTTVVNENRTLRKAEARVQNGGVSFQDSDFKK